MKLPDVFRYGAMALGLQAGGDSDALPGTFPEERAPSAQTAAPSETVEISSEDLRALLESNARAVEAQAERLPADPLWRHYYAEGAARAERELTRLFENPTSTEELKKQLRSLTGFEQDAAFIAAHVNSKEMRATLLTLRLARAAKAIELISMRPGPDASTLMLSVLAANRPADLSVKSSIQHSGWLFGVGRGDRDAVVSAMEANPGTVKFGSVTDAQTISLANVARFDLAVGAGRLTIPAELLSDFRLRSVVRQKDGTLLSCMAIGSGCEANANEITFKSGHGEDANAFPLIGPGTGLGSGALEPPEDDVLSRYWLQRDLREPQRANAEMESDRKLEEETKRISALFAGEGGGGSSSGGGNGPFAVVSDGSGQGDARLVRMYGNNGLRLPIDVSPNVPKRHYEKLARALNAATQGTQTAERAKATEKAEKAQEREKATSRPEQLRSQPPRSRSGVPEREQPSEPKPKAWNNPEGEGVVYFEENGFPDIRDGLYNMEYGYEIELHPGSKRGPDDGRWGYDLNKIIDAIDDVQRDQEIKEALNSQPSESRYKWEKIVMTKEPAVVSFAHEPTMNFNVPGDSLKITLLRAINEWNAKQPPPSKDGQPKALVFKTNY